MYGIASTIFIFTSSEIGKTFFFLRIEKGKPNAVIYATSNQKIDALFIT